MSTTEAVINELQLFLRNRRNYVVAHAGQVEEEIKADESIVTQIDREIEQGARDIINRLQPEAGIYGEEFGIEGDDKTFWTIDPIDGTAYFIRGLPEYMFMAAYVENDQPLAAIMYNYATDEMYLTLPGQATTINGKQIGVSKRDFTINAYIETESHFDYRAKITQKFADQGMFLSLPYWRAGYGLAQVAAGKIDARFQYKPYGKLYDFLPGAIMVLGAGGEVVNVGSDAWDYKNLDTIISNGVVTEGIQNILTKIS